MQAFLVIVVFVLGGTLLAAATYAAVVGLLGVVTDERFERCPRCHRRGLTTGGVRHPGGCPTHGAIHVPHGWHLHRVHHA